MTRGVKQRIGIDIDDVILGTNEQLTEWHNEFYGTSYTFDQICNFDLSPLWGCSKVEMYRRLSEYFVSEHHDNTSTKDGALSALEELSFHYNIIAITGRDGTYQEITKALLERLLVTKHVVGIVHASSDKKSHFPNKGSACRYYNIRVFVEDAPYHTRSIINSGTPCLLYDTPWNRDIEEHPDVRRVFSWSEIPDLVHTEVRRA